MSNSQPQPDDADLVRVTEDTVRIRRAPRFGAFIVVGALVGFLITLIVTVIYSNLPVAPGEESTQAVGLIPLVAYFSLFGVSIGAALGAAVAIILDRVSARRAREATVEHTSVEPGPVTGQLED